VADLSPAAQAVLDEVLYRMSAGESDSYAKWIAAAAIRAAADQVVPPIPDDCTADVFNRQLKIRSELYAIATELDPTP
jgi:hypothetical protein